jgi:hypothetical protein
VKVKARALLALDTPCDISHISYEDFTTGIGLDDDVMQCNTIQLDRLMFDKA